MRTDSARCSPRRQSACSAMVSAVGSVVARKASASPSAVSACPAPAGGEADAPGTHMAPPLDRGTYKSPSAGLTRLADRFPEIARERTSFRCGGCECALLRHLLTQFALRRYADGAPMAGLLLPREGTINQLA